MSILAHNMPRNGNDNGNGLERRLEKLESAFALFVNLLDRKTARLLFSSHTKELNRLLNRHETGADGIKSLSEMLRRIEGDKEQAREVRLICTLLLISIELKDEMQKRRK